MKTETSEAAVFVKANLAVLERFHHHLTRERVQRELLAEIGASSNGIIEHFSKDFVEAAVNKSLEYLPGYTAPIEFDLVWAVCRADSIELIAYYARQLPEDVIPKEDIPSTSLVEALLVCHQLGAEINEDSLNDLVGA